MVTESEKLNLARSDCALETIRAYVKRKYGASHATHPEPELLEEITTDLLTDLRHMLRDDVDPVFEKCVARSARHYAEEIGQK